MLASKRLEVHLMEDLWETPSRYELSIRWIALRARASPMHDVVSGGLRDVGGSGENFLVWARMHATKAGGFDKLLLNSLYEDTARQQQIAALGYYGGADAANPFDSRDPFAMSNNIAPPSNVQMALMAQQQQQYYYQQQLNEQYYYQQQQQQYYYQQQQQHQQNTMMMVPYAQQPQNNARQQMGNTTAANPFGDPFLGLSGLPQTSAPPTQGNHSLL